MKKFMLLYMSPVSAEENMANAGPDDMKPWMEWFGKVGSAMVDMGMPLSKGVNVTKDGSSEGTSHLVGYSIVQAADMDAAKALASDHPHLMQDGTSIEVVEVLPAPGM
jgi:hypothetical protein